MDHITPIQITTGLQQIVMRLIGIMMEKGQLSENEAQRIFAEAALTLRQHPSADTNGAAFFVDMLAAQFAKKTS